jgi:hypothetical protein
LQRAGEGPPERLDLGIAIVVSKYGTRRSVRKTDHGRHTRKGACKDASSLWVLEPLLSCSSLSPTKVRLLMVQTFIYPRSCMARKCGTHEGGQRQDVSGRKALRSILAHPETALLTFCTGTLGYFHRCTH